MLLSPSRFIAALGLSVTLAAPLAAQTPPQTPAPTAPVAEGMALSQIIAGLEAQGYRIKEVDVGRSRIDVEALTVDGKEVELEVNPVDGVIVSIHHEI